MKVTAHVQRSGGWWAVDVPDVPGVFTQARRLDQVPAEVADAVATMLDVDPSTVEVEVAAPALDARLDPTISQVRRLAAEAEEAQRAASTAMREAVSALRTKVGLSVRDVGALLGISHQRVAQLEGTSLGEGPMFSGCGKGKQKTGALHAVKGKAAPGKVAAKKSASQGKLVTKKSAAGGSYKVAASATRSAGARKAPSRTAAAKSASSTAKGAAKKAK